MIIRLTSITLSDIDEVVSDALFQLEERINKIMAVKSYGADITLALIVLISVDKLDNKKFAKPHNRVSRVKDVYGSMARQINIAVEVDPESIRLATESDVQRIFAVQLCNRIKDPGMRLPAEFEWAEFASDLKVSIS